MTDTKKKAYIEYHTNNSGGDWWLSDKDWKNLEKAGWVVHWYHDPKADDHVHDPVPNSSDLSHHTHSYGDDVLVPAKPSGDDFLGARATSAAKVTDDPDGAVEEFEILTNSTASDEGCNCCGPPHSFTFHNDKDETTYLRTRVTGYETGWSKW